MPMPLFGVRSVTLAGLFAATVVSGFAQRMTLSDRSASPVVVESAEIHTEVTGRIAVTTFDLTFFNPNSRVLEGTFEFPLLAGQSVVRFALDINGRLREAVPVEKERGRVVFEEIERRGIDPGLLEQTAGNNYRARVYPILAHGKRRVVIAYQEDVARHGATAYRLPLDFATPLKTFHLVVLAHTDGRTEPMARTTLDLVLPPWRDARTLDITRENFTARGVLELELPAAVHPSVLTQHRGDEDYFYAEVPMPGAAAKSRPVPKVVGLLWDASGSGRDRDHAREWALLDAWFERVHDVTVKLVVLRDHAAAPRSFTVRNGKWAGLRDELEHMVYDGATSFDGLGDDATVQEWLLFTDGLVNFGVTQKLTRLPVQAPVHVVLASVRADSARLRAIARAGGGESVDLLQQSAAAAAAVLRSESIRVIAVERDPQQVAEVYPERNEVVVGGTLMVTGRLLGKAATLRVRVGHSAADAVPLEVTIKAGDGPSELAARAWAVAKIAALAVEQTANREDIRRTSQTFGIVTADSSLIVLENLQDYVRYDIIPPDEFRAAWEAARRPVGNAGWKDRESHVEDVVRRFQERIAWWETKFPQKPEMAKQKQEYEESRNLSVVTGGFRLRNPDAVAETRQQRAARAAVDASGEIVQLSPFEVASDRASGFAAANTLSGSRIGGMAYGRGSWNAPAVAMPVPALTLSAQGGSVAGNVNSGGAVEGEGPGTSIGLQRWDPQAGYLDRLRRAEESDRYAVYLEERATHDRQPGFFLDVAGYFFEAKDAELGLRVLSNLAEMQLDDAPLLRVLANRLVEVGRPELARPLLERVLVLRGEEPQSRRDLALVCAALKDYQRAVDLLWEVVSRPWDARFPGIELIALGEMNGIIATAPVPLDLSRIDARLRRNLPVGLRAVLTWDADACDIDLWVDDPSGERAIYSHPRTAQGGRMSSDFTGGYGPEEFLLRDPKPGTYTIRINYFGERRQTTVGPVTAQVRLITGFGTPDQKERRLTVRLSETKESLEIGTIEIAPDPRK